MGLYTGRADDARGELSGFEPPNLPHMELLLLL